jgi:hypothetical protein
MVALMCTGSGAPHCPDERLAWQLYEEHGYQPRELRPCLTAPRPVVTEPPHHERARHWLLRLLVRCRARGQGAAQATRRRRPDVGPRTGGATNA